MYTVVAAASSSSVSLAAHAKQSFQQRVGELLRTVFLNNRHAKPSLLNVREVDYNVVLSDNPGIILLHPVLQLLRQQLSPWAHFVGLTSGHSDDVAPVTLPFHRFNEDGVRIYAALFVQKSLELLSRCLRETLRGP